MARVEHLPSTQGSIPRSKNGHKASSMKQVELKEAGTGCSRNFTVLRDGGLTQAWAGYSLKISGHRSVRSKCVWLECCWSWEAEAHTTWSWVSLKSSAESKQQVSENRLGSCRFKEGMSSITLGSPV